MQRTEEEVIAEVEALKAVAARLPKTRHNVGLMLDVLEDDMTIEDVYSRYDSEDNHFPYAMRAALWLCGATDEQPSKRWN